MEELPARLIMGGEGIPRTQWWETDHFGGVITLVMPETGFITVRRWFDHSSDLCFLNHSFHKSVTNLDFFFLVLKLNSRSLAPRDWLSPTAFVQYEES